MAKKGKGFSFVSSTALIVIIAVMCVIFFYTCSLKPAQPEEPEAPITQPVVEPEVETIVETPPVVEPGPEAEPEPVVEPVVEEQPVQTEPEAVVVIEDLGVPDAPDLDWFVYTELYTDRSDNWDSALFSDEIDWSQFVFSDEEIVLPDGTYYAQLYVNDSPFGNVQFEQVESTPKFLREDLANELNGTLAADYFEQFFSNEETYYTMEYLEELAESVKYDSNNLLLYLYFNSSQVPVQTLSMSSSSYSLLRQNYDVVGNVKLEPAHFSFQSNISAFFNAQYVIDSGSLVLSGLSASLSLSNTFSFWNMTFSLPFSLSMIKGSGVIPSLGKWSGYLDFPNENLRLSFGHVGNAGFSAGTPYGFTLEKSYSFGTGSAMTNQYEQTITLVEDSTVDIRVNGNSVYTKTLSLGVYRLTDFAFVQGSNDVVVTIHPISMGEDTSNDQIINFSQDYDTSLMAKGESTWKFGMSIPEINQAVGTESSYPFGFVVPALPQYSSSQKKFVAMENVYNLSAVSVFWEQSIGLAHAYTQTQSFSFVYERNADSSTAPGEYTALFNGTVSGTLATGIGTTRATLSGVLSSSNDSRNSLTLNVSQSFVNQYLKPLSLSGSYSLTSGVQTVSLNTGYSFSLKSVRLGLSLSSSYKFYSDSASVSTTTKPWTLNGSLSLGTSFGKNASFSLNASLNQDLNFYATASLSVSLGRQSVNSSVTTSNLKTLIGNAGWYYRPSSSSRNSFQVNLSNLDLLHISQGSLLNHTLSATWSRSGDLVSMSLRQQASNNYKRFNTSLSLNTALAFADGYFAMTNSIYSPFVIVAPQGSLKKATVSVSNAVDSANNSAKKTFGNVLYTRLSMYKSNNIVVYASNGSLFTSAGSFLFKVTPLARQGFLAKITLESSVAVSGIIRQSESQVYDSYSSPIYKVTLAEDGISVQSIEIDSSSYFFTDIDGRYILSDLAAGVYMFDLNISGQWYAAFFEVPSVDEAGYVAIFDEFDASTVVPGEDPMQKYNIKTFDDSYAGSVFIGLSEFMTEEKYWDMLFQLADVDDSWEDNYDDESWYWDESQNDEIIYEQVTNTAL